MVCDVHFSTDHRWIALRGADFTQEVLFTVAKLNDFVPANHPLRKIRTLVDAALRRMSGLFNMWPSRKD